MIPQDIANAIVSPKAHGERAPVDEAFSWLRANAPLAEIEPEGFDKFWAVTRHKDIQYVERNSDVFWNGTHRSTVPVDSESLKQIIAITGGRPSLIMSLLEMDGKTHFKYRQITQKAFMPINLGQLSTQIEETADKAIDRLISKNGACDFAKDVAFLYPLHVIMELLGVPASDEPLMLKLTQELFGSADPDVNQDASDDPEEMLAALQAVVAEFGAYFGALAEDRRANPRDDLASVIANATVDGEPLGPIEVLSYFIVIATAGHDSTSNSIASGMWQLAENPDQFSLLKNNRDLLDGFIDESIRWETPVRTFMRNAVEDVEMAGQKIRKGDWLMLCYPSGNRDEEVFDRPFEFDITRPKKHVAFGYGAHICLGQHLARLKMKLLWSKILDRLTHVELNGTPTRIHGNFVSGPKSLPIKYGIE